MADRGVVLVSWVAVNNDPYERDRDTGAYRTVDGRFIDGPTLNLLTDPDSPYAGRVTDFAMLHRSGPTDKKSREMRAVSETLEALARELPALKVHPNPWHGDDPTDHQAIFEFLQERLPAIRRKFPGRELLFHASPGTPSMQTVMVLMAETGFIEQPFEIVKSYRKDERRGRPAVVPIKLGIDTFYKAYKISRPLQAGKEEQAVVWDPAKFCSERMKQLFAEARRIAQVNVPVLIVGERGTGKTTLASWIRLHSPYRRAEQDAHWPAVACGQYSSETMRSELFGYKKGAFTGAVTDRTGLLDSAHQDTLFLDEIGDISRELQRLLIKALEEKRYSRLGDVQTRESDFRLISATNLPADEIRKRIDPDFLDRISLFKLTLPPLREIREELPWLWDSVYQQATTNSGAPASRARLKQAQRQHILGALALHPLPGNLRDLFKLAYRLIAAQTDVHEPLSPEAAVMYGLESLNECDPPALDDDMARRVAKAFADRTSLGPAIETFGQIQTKAIDHSFKAYLATELQRHGKSTGEPAESYCDVSERSLRQWASKQFGK